MPACSGIRARNPVNDICHGLVFPLGRVGGLTNIDFLRGWLVLWGQAFSRCCARLQRLGFGDGRRANEKGSLLEVLRWGWGIVGRNLKHLPAGESDGIPDGDWIDRCLPRHRRKCSRHNHYEVRNVIVCQSW